ncbi:hypothetical protein ATG_14600 [Desulfurococcaceae archaeon AG1]|nr:hypothetical protein ATG_14600 [Desulfurococcaceae archaeon AG1]
MPAVELVSVTKRFGRTVAVDSVSFSVEKGELFTILGPSGCGKTTTLRLIAGLEIPDGGRIYIGGRDVTWSKPYERNTAMVFQNWALWPHMSVFDNIAYGLRVRKVPGDEVRRRVKRILEIVGLEGLENRYPHQLSGGQQQRVALARALVVEPEVLLLDEPLSNLDARLRISMRSEIRSMQKKLGITAIYVTHDQEEAMSISDRIGVMDKGRMIQIGSPEEIYRNPRNLFVATFIGKSATIEGKIIEINSDIVEIETPGGRIKARWMDREKPITGGRAVIVIRPEETSISRQPKGPCIEGVLKNTSFLGDRTQVTIEIGGRDIITYTDPRETETLRSREASKIYLCLEEPPKAFQT